MTIKMNGEDHSFGWHAVRF